MSAAGEAGDRMIEADLSFHRALLLASHNELLAETESVIEAPLRMRDQLVHGRAPWKDPMPEHRACSQP
jgi:DNA-binding FadR family transcriptional regulator